MIRMMRHSGPNLSGKDRLFFQKEGKKSTPKGREAEVTSTVRERSHANNARLLCLECQLKTSLASQEHAYRRRFFVILSVDANSIE